SVRAVGNRRSNQRVEGFTESTMIEFVFKPTGARLYSGRYRVTGEARITTVRLSVTDKQVARAKLRSIVQQRERELAGIVPPSAEVEAGNTSLREHLDALLQFKARTRDAKYLAAFKNQVVTILDECGWTVLRDLNAEQFERWRQNRRGTAKTLNEYLTAIRTLVNWMVATRRASDNPLRHVEL